MTLDAGCTYTCWLYACSSRCAYKHWLGLSDLGRGLTVAVAHSPLNLAVLVFHAGKPTVARWPDAAGQMSNNNMDFDAF